LQGVRLPDQGRHHTVLPRLLRQVLQELFHVHAARRLKPAYQKQPPAVRGEPGKQALCPRCQNKRVVFVPAE
jgi:hypothetical protein